MPRRTWTRFALAILLASAPQTCHGRHGAASDVDERDTTWGKHDGQGAVATRQAEPAVQIELLKTMQCIRRFEELYPGGELPGFIHLSIGQEACVADAWAALRTDDDITSTHRGHGHCLAKGAPMSRMMAELYSGAFMSTQ